MRADHLAVTTCCSEPDPDMALLAAALESDCSASVAPWCESSPCSKLSGRGVDASTGSVRHGCRAPKVRTLAATAPLTATAVARCLRERARASWATMRRTEDIWRVEGHSEVFRCQQRFGVVAPNLFYRVLGASRHTFARLELGECGVPETQQYCDALSQSSNARRVVGDRDAQRAGRMSVADALYEGVVGQLFVFGPQLVPDPASEGGLGYPIGNVRDRDPNRFRKPTSETNLLS